jgi:hypothetical protein
MVHQFNRHIFIITILACSTGLTACQSTTDAPMRDMSQPPIPSSISYTPANFQMPTGTGCQGDIDRWKAIQYNDLQLGHVSPSIYTQIQTEIKGAQDLCTAGQAAQASAAVTASKRRHGYPN